ncbi:MAG: TolC family protein [Sulfurimonas sp.]|nr:TolC family protein [Sulfurimonas sp.]
MRLKQIHLHNDYILRHSIESKSTKPYMLSAPKVNLDMTSLPNIEKEALTNSSDVAIESNILKVKKADLLFQKRRFYPEVRFNSHLGYGMGNLDTFDLSNSGNGDYWDFGLTFKMPIYNRNDINLNEEKEEYEIMKQKSVLSSKQREILIQVDNYYGNINRINEERNILQEQNELMDKKLTVSKEQFVSGLAEYRDYANAMRDYLDYTNQYMQMEQQYIQSVSILSILIGKKEFYEQD